MATTWSATDKQQNTLSNGNLTATATVGGFSSGRTTTSWSAGKIYLEMKLGGSGSSAQKGMNGELGWYGFTSGQMAPIVATLQDLGITWVRLPFDWDSIQSVNASTFDYSQIDIIVTALLGAKINILGLIAYCANWAGPNLLGPPTSNATFATYCAALANRYKSQGVHTWEIWNEPNISVFWGGRTPSASAYTALLGAAYTALHAADPLAFVLSAGLAPASPTPAQFLQSMYAAGAAGKMDAVGAHPYVYGESPQTPRGGSGGAWDQMDGPSGTTFRSLMTTNGDGAKKIWITEFGMPNAANIPADGTEALQSDSVTAAFSNWQGNAYAGPIFWYNLQDDHLDPNDDEANFGLIRSNGVQRTAYATLKATSVSASISNSMLIGVANTSWNLFAELGQSTPSNSVGVAVGNFDEVYVNNTFFSGGVHPCVSGDTVSMAVDYGVGRFWYSTDQMQIDIGAGAWNNSLTDNPATGTGGLDFSSQVGPFFGAWYSDTVGNSATINAHASWHRTIPSGFTPADGAASSGVISITEAADTSGGITGKVMIGGVLVKTEAPDTMSATGTTSLVTRSGPLIATSQTNPFPDSLADAFGGAPVNAEAGDWMVASGIVSTGIPLFGSIIVTEASDTISSTGTVITIVRSGVISVTEGADTMFGLGFAGSVNTGVISVTETADTMIGLGFVGSVSLPILVWMD